MTTREAFEEWAIEAGYSVERIAYDPDNFLSGQYKSILTNTRWLAWQAATDAALERAADAVSIVDSKTWFESQSLFSVACRKAIRALKDADKC